MNCPVCGKNMILSFTVVSYSSMQISNGSILSKQVTHELDERVQPSYRCDCGNVIYVDYKQITCEIPLNNIYIPDKTLAVPAIYARNLRYPIKESIRKGSKRKHKHVPRKKQAKHENR